METKAPHPEEYLRQPVFKEVDPLIAAYFEISQLKLLYRQGWLRKGVGAEQCESVAEHSYGVVFLAMWLADAYFPETDRLKVMRMAVLHDLGEVYCGDLTPADEVGKEEKARREQQAVETVLGKLPVGDAYIALWQEYEHQRSPEARLVRCADRLEMALQACVYEYQTGLNLGEFLDSAAKILDDDVYRKLMSDLEKVRPRE